MKHLLKKKDGICVVGGINQARFRSKEAALKYTPAIKNNSSTRYKTNFTAHTILEYAASATKGNAVIPAELRNDKKIIESNFVSQQLFMVDVDNVNEDKTKHNEYKTAHEILEHQRSYSVEPSFIYPTYNSS